MQQTENKELIISYADTGEIKARTNYAITAEELQEQQKQKEKGRAVYHAKDKYYQEDRRKFVINFMDNIRGIMPSMTLTEAGVLMRLLPYTQGKGEIKENGKHLKLTDIQKIIKRSEKPTRQTLSQLEKLGLLTSEGKPKRYKVNPNYHHIGNLHGRKGEKFVKLYKNKAKELLDGLTLNECGLVYKILPFFHYETFILCANPNEPKPELFEELSQTKLAELIGHDYGELKTLLAKLRGKGVLLQTESSHVKSHYVHPSLMYRKDYDTEHARQLRAMFERNEIRKQARRR